MLRLLFILLVVLASLATSVSHGVFELNIKDPILAREIYHDLEAREGTQFIGVLGPLSYLVSTTTGEGPPKRILREGRYNVTQSRRRLLPPHLEKKSQQQEGRKRQRFIVQLVSLKAQGWLQDALPKGSNPRWSFIGNMKYAVAVNEEYVNATRFLLSSSPWVATFDFVRENKHHGLFANEVILSGGEQYTTAPLESTLTGDGVMIAVGDTGVDMSHKGFKRFSPEYFTYKGQDTKLNPLPGKTVYLSLDLPDGDGGRVLTDQGDEHNGHGTSMAWLAAGDHKERKSRSDLLVVDFMRGEGSYLAVPDSIEGLLGVIYESGARVFSNSWGSDSRGEYTFTAMEFDDFVWKNQDLCIVISAGNSGPERRTVTSPGVAKNGITVGASQNSKQSFLSPLTNDSSYWDGPEYKGFQATGSCENIAAFSSRGPTADGRVKPDIVAPGQFILAARAKPGSGEKNMHFTQGTSPAAPLVANLVAKLQEGLRKQFKLPNPTCALIKAVLVSHARPLEGGSSTMMFSNKTGLIGAVLNKRPLDQDQQGFGRVYLPPILDMWVRDRQPLSVLGQWVHKFTILKDSAITITIAWADPPVIPYGTKKTLINDLNLRVILGGEENVYLLEDHLNNIERVKLFAKQGEEMVVIVSPWGPLTPYSGIEQTFSIAINGPVSLLPPPLRCHPKAPAQQCMIGGELGGRACLPNGEWGPCRARCHQKDLFWLNQTSCGCLIASPCPPLGREGWVRMRECRDGNFVAPCPDSLPRKPIPRRRLREDVSQVVWIWLAVSAVVVLLFYAFHIKKKHKRWGIT